MDPLDAHRRAQHALSEVFARVEPAQLERGTPCEGWRVRDVLEHVIAGNELVPVRLGTASAPPDRPPDVAAALAATGADAQRAFEAPGALARAVELGTREVPGSVFLRMRTTDAFVHAWDLAKATGQTTALDPDVAGYLLERCREQVGEGARGPGRAFGAVRPCPEDRPAADQLAAYLGRAVG